MYRRDHYSKPPRGESRMPVVIAAIVVFIAVLIWAILSTVAKVSAPGKDTLVVGVNTPFPPFEDRNGEKVVGLDIDLVIFLAESLGKKVTLKDFSEFDALLPALQNGSLDIVISAVTIREDRDEVVDFSESYFDASQAILKKGDYPLVYSGDTAVFAGVKVGYQTGTTSESWAEENLKDKVGVLGLTPFGDMAVGLELLRVGSIDVIILDEPAAKSFAKTQKGLALAGTIETGEHYGIAVRNGDPDKLLPGINYALKKMKETGKYDELVLKWFKGVGNE